MSHARLPEGSAARLREVVEILMLEGLELPLARMRISHCASLRCRLHCTWQRWIGRAPSRPWPQAVRRALERLGPAFIKVGQILSVRSDLIPAALAAELRGLQSNVPAAPWATIKPGLEAALGKRIEDAFSAFATTPVAAASIAQVYRAELPDGTPVAVKVKRPAIDAQVRLDMEILVWLAEQLQHRVAAASHYDPVGTANEVRRYTLQELDLAREAEVARALGAGLRKVPDVKVPTVHFSSADVIVMDYIEGVPIDDAAAIRAGGTEPRAVVERALEAMLVQIFELGLFHADPHPGNLLVTPRGELVFLDFGIVGRLDERLQRNCTLMFWSLLSDNIELATHLMLRISELEPEADVAAFRKHLAARYRDWRAGNVSVYGIGRLAYDELSLGGRYGVILPPDVLLLGKALVTLEGVALALAPDLNVADAAKPYLARIRGKLVVPRRIRHTIVQSLPLWADLLEQLPMRLWEQVERQPAAPALSTTRLHAMPKSLDLYGPASVLAGSWLLAARIGPLWYDISILGAVLLASGVLGAVVRLVRA